MVYDETLAQRLRQVVGFQAGVREKKMFGGLTFLVQGNMCCGVLNQDLVVRVRPDGHGEGMAQPHVRPMDFTGRKIKGMVYVEPMGYESDEALEAWVQRGLKFALSLPAK